MARAVTLFTGQWADLSLETLAQKCSTWGFGGIEFALSPLAQRTLTSHAAQIPTTQTGMRG